MDLKYIWIKDYGIIKETGFNFNNSDGHKFSFDGEKLEQDNAQENLLSFGDHVQSLTVIAGQNGSGKTTLLNCVLDCVATLSNGIFGFDYEIITIVCIGNNIYYHESLEITNLEELEQNFDVFPYKESPFENEAGGKTKEFIKNGFIYYSNFLDGGSQMHHVNLSNLSTNQLIYDDAYNGNLNSLERNVTPRFPSRSQINTDPVTAHVFQNNYRFLRLMTEEPEALKFSFHENTTIIINMTNVWSNSHLNPYSLNPDPNFKNIQNVGLVQNEIYGKIKEYGILDPAEFSISNDQIIAAVISQVKLNITVSNAINKNQNLNLEKLREVVFGDFEVDDIYENRNEVFEYLNALEKLLEVSHFQNDFVPKDIVTSGFFDDWRFYTYKGIYLKHSEKSFGLLRALIKYEKIAFTSGHGMFRRLMNYSFTPKFSSGQYSAANLFSRLYDKLKDYNTGYDHRDKVIILIDEGEIGFHPEWQREYLSDILKFLNGDWHGGLKFQVILTTHSPYLLSDLPQENVVLLKRSDDNLTEIESRENYKTFGANISDLLADSFFLKDTLLGSFAEEKITKLISKIEDREITNREEPIILEIADDYLRISIQNYVDSVND